MDHAKAAHQYRLQQAAALVRRVMMVAEVAPDHSPPCAELYFKTGRPLRASPHLYTARSIVLSDRTDQLDYLIDVVQRAHGNLFHAAPKFEVLVQMTGSHFATYNGNAMRSA